MIHNYQFVVKIVFAPENKMTGLKRPKLIITTGTSGCGRNEHLDDPDGLIKCAASFGKNIEKIPLGDLMLEHAAESGFKINRDNIHNADPDILKLLRSAVLKNFISLWECGKYDHLDAVLMNIHGVFYWKGQIIESYDEYLNKIIPDMYITYIDDHRAILSRLAAEKKWRTENLTTEKILMWQNTEVTVTKTIAIKDEKPFWVVPTAKETVPTSYKLIFHPEIEAVYPAMPISHFQDAESRIPLNNIIKELYDYFPVFNPLACEMIGAVDTKGTSFNQERIIHSHITLRDVQWFIRQADTIIVIWPESLPPKKFRDNAELYEEILKYWPKAVSSPGVDHETHNAFIKTKNVWVVYLGKEASPFITHYNTGLFGSKEDFVKFLNERYPGRKDMFKK